MSPSRIASAVVLIVMVGGTIWWMPAWATVALAALAAAAAGAELSRMAAAIGGRVPALFTAAAAAACAVALAAPELTGSRLDPAMLVPLILAAALASGLLTLALVPPGLPVFVSLAAFLLAPVYVGLPLGALASIRIAYGPAALVWLIAVISISDSAQYYAGTFFGRRKLAPVVSPGKTIEGALGGVLAGPLAGVALAGWALPDVGRLPALALAMVLVWFGMAGDLFESLLKRSTGLKDSSTIIPGHGGVLDRIDAYLFAAPVFYVYLRFLA